jgi:hypothetical protein
MIAKDFPGTIKKLSSAGFQTIELFAGGYPLGFAGLPNTGPNCERFPTGVSCISSHFGIEELGENQQLH